MYAFKALEQETQGFFHLVRSDRHPVQVGYTGGYEGHAHERLINSLQTAGGDTALALVAINGDVRVEDGRVNGDRITVVAVVGADETIDRCVDATVDIALKAISGAKAAVYPAAYQFLSDWKQNRRGLCNKARAADLLERVKQAGVACEALKAREYDKGGFHREEYIEAGTLLARLQCVQDAVAAVSRYVNGIGYEHAWQKGWPNSANAAMHMYKSVKGYEARAQGVRVLEEMDKAEAECEALLLNYFPEFGKEA